MILIIANIITMAMPYSGQSGLYSKILDSLNYLFTSIFIFEASLKIFSLNFIRYIINPWNKFDFLVVLASILEILLNNIETSGSLSFL